MQMLYILKIWYKSEEQSEIKEVKTYASTEAIDHTPQALSGVGRPRQETLLQ